ncbi:MAG: tRNA pseudouridine(38-40) synthase TruA [Aeromicrobium sp.]|nr:tRNA pseudouridine(38-40) synthase TruA [Aeromicrobium sp.]
MRLRLDLSYDGANFRGWGIQPGLRTVQGEVESAIATVMRLKETPSLTCAGRTDAGVHARGQVAHVDLDNIDPVVLARRLRRFLPSDIGLRDLTVAADGFDARFAALERRYIYRLCDAPAGPDPLRRGEVVWWARPLDVDAMNEAATHLLGHHDFASFCKKRKGATTIRTLVELRTTRRKDLVETSVRADAFCHSMVRSLMGVLVAVGEGRFEPSWAGEVLSHAARNARVTVLPPHGLVLEEVIYPNAAGLAARAKESRRRRDE